MCQIGKLSYVSTGQIVKVYVTIVHYVSNFVRLHEMSLSPDISIALSLLEEKTFICFKPMLLKYLLLNFIYSSDLLQFEFIHRIKQLYELFIFWFHPAIVECTVSNHHGCNCYALGYKVILVTVGISNYYYLSLQVLKVINKGTVSSTSLIGSVVCCR